MIEIKFTGEALDVRAEMEALLGTHTAEGIVTMPEAPLTSDLNGQAPSSKKRSHRKKPEEPVAEKPVEPATEKLEESVTLQSEALTEDQKVDLRTKTAEYCHSHADGKDKIKAFLGAKGLSKVTDMDNSMLPEYMALLEG